MGEKEEMGSKKKKDRKTILKTRDNNNFIHNINCSFHYNLLILLATNDWNKTILQVTNFTRETSKSEASQGNCVDLVQVNCGLLCVSMAWKPHHRKDMNKMKVQWRAIKLTIMGLTTMKIRYSRVDFSDLIERFCSIWIRFFRWLGYDIRRDHS